jgi:hypothetical protein
VDVDQVGAGSVNETATSPKPRKNVKSHREETSFKGLRPAAGNTRNVVSIPFFFAGQTIQMRGQYLDLIASFGKRLADMFGGTPSPAADGRKLMVQNQDTHQRSFESMFRRSRIV